ncbi:indolepyruvate oxidoreductase subunit beta [Thermodesulforhabdus norvegica]|uniref:Indolepyruvate ferredoxin oxidoreductase, subunit iorB n=1 Tax=Thermodesulforhabdus norvegica TaxID=39841 RepID=A0A1I4TYD5_9BACT|nr:indolepyruvate oxidoreductase subunit beta [Thermodesulforhabdus norvegica]SFM81754.1 indolepyruvate ferredoxin oxidoreductase, subunit iorB [Thermodesulforhabdus norvegica]
MKNEKLRLFFTGVGGQGILLATRMIGEAALLADTPVSMSEVHGMAQRGGVVESSVVLGKRWSPVIGQGEADILVAMEPLEALRALPRCHEKTVAVVNSVPIPPFSVSRGEATYPDIDYMVSELKKNLCRVYVTDAREIALKAGSERAVNIVLVGVLFGLGLLPLERKHLEQALFSLLPERLVDMNLRAFEGGVEEGFRLQSEGERCSV